MKKYFFALLMMFVMCVTLCSTAFAKESKPSKYSKIKAHAEKFMKAHTVNYLLEEPIELYNLEDKVVALFFKSTKSGYIIVNTENLTVPEFSPTENNKFITNRNIKYFYNGPLTYMEKVGDSIIDLKSHEAMGNEKQLKTQLKRTMLYGTENITAATNTKSATRATQDQIYGTVPNYSYNPTGICGSTASAMLTRYYDIYVDGRFVPSYLESSDGVALTKHLVPYIDGSTPGSTATELRNGLNNYLSDQGVSKRVSTYYSSLINTIKSSVSSDNPYILGLYNHPKYGNHWVTGYGYYDSSDDYALVNDGWGSVNVWIHLYYADVVAK